MRDLYARNSLAPYEANPAILRAALSGAGPDQEAARFVLQHEGRKQIYDRTHATLTLIGELRGALDLNESMFWQAGEFTTASRPAPAPDLGVWRRRTLAEQLGRLLAPVRFALTYPRLTITGAAGAFVLFAQLTEEPRSVQRTAPVVAATAAGAHSKPINFSSLKRIEHVTAQALNVRAAPSAQAAVVGKLAQYDTVQVDSKASANGWSKIEFGGGSGFVASQYLGEGDGAEAKRADCRRAGIRRPYSGEVLSQVGRGDHSIQVKAGGNRDAIVKLKDRGGATVLAMYVRAGESASVSSIPEGVFKFMYATGSSYSDLCGIFLDDVSAASADDYTAYETEYVPGGRYTTTTQYTLYEVYNGNFTPTPMDPKQF